MHIKYEYSRIHLHFFLKKKKKEKSSISRLEPFRRKETGRCLLLLANHEI